MEDKVKEVKIKSVINGYIITFSYFCGEYVYIAETVPQLLNTISEVLNNPKEI